ncbi:MAG: maltose alpha-D-glucosyltransferase [Chloroflexi bacterium]|nr:maltose alpha-D-glucosyltransferase [Chloroflexota bacterium]
MNSEPLWYKKAVFYELYVRAFQDSSGDGNGDLRGVIEKLDYLSDLGVTAIWLLPIFPSPLKDDGYDVAHFTDIHPDYGNLEDFKDLIREAHARGIKVITDLVLNHTSDQHPWFQAARSDPSSPFRDFYVWSDTKERFADARIIFLDTEESNWSWDELAGQYYWHRFYSSQPDLNYDNPDVRQEMLNVMRFWLDLGIDGFRVDAIPYLFEREGTNCENLPETHAFLKEVRKFVEMNYPGCVLLSEANQLPQDVLPYFGQGDEMHMAFHFPLMPRIFMALRNGEADPIREILDATPAIPDSAQWNLFLRNHDELTLEMVTPEVREWMWEEYAPEPRMRQNLGIRRRLAPLLDNSKAKIGLAHSLLFTLPGSPTLYYGDEIGMGDNVWLEDRNGVRTPMQWNRGKNAGFSEAEPEALYSPVISESPYGQDEVNVADQVKDEGGLLALVKQMIKVRQAHRAFPLGDMQWASCNDQTHVLAYWRTDQEHKLLIVNNMSNKAVELGMDLLDDIGGVGAEDLFGGKRVGEIQGRKLHLKLEAYGYAWLALN